MKYSDLLNLQSVGVLKLSIDSGGNAVLAGIDLTESQLNTVLKSIGWEKWVEDSTVILKKTASIIQSFKNNLDFELFKNAEITFRNSRKSGTEKIVTRIYIQKSPSDKIMIISGSAKMQRYSLYSIENNFQFPVDSFSSLKGTCEYINEMYG